MSHVHFTLYVAGDSPRSRTAEANLRRLCDARLAGRYRVTVVDVTRAAERAEEARILTTPTLVREAPAPARRVTGDLGDEERLWVLLGLDALTGDGPSPATRPGETDPSHEAPRLHHDVS